MQAFEHPVHEIMRALLSTYKNAFSGISRENWLLSLVMLINRAGTMVVPFMSIYVTQVMGRNLADAGLIITLFGCGAVMGSVAGGYLTDLFGFRPVQVISSFITGVMFILFGRLHDFTSVCMISVLIGCVSEAFRPANFTAIASYAEARNITQSYSLNRLAVNIGFGLGSTIGGILAAIDFRLLFWTEGIVYILVSLLIIILLPGRENKKSRRQHTRQKTKDASPYRDTLFMKFIFLATIYITSFYLVFRLVPVYWKEVKGIPENHIGFILGLNGIIIALFEMLLIKHLDKKNKRAFFMSLGIAFAAFSFIFLLIPVSSAATAFLTIIFFTIGEMLALPFMNTFIIERASRENRGRYASVFSLCWATAQITGPAGGAFIAERTSYQVLWAILIVCCTLSSVGLHLLFKKHRHVLSPANG